MENKEPCCLVVIQVNDLFALPCASLPLPVLAFKICVTVEFVAQSILMDWLKGRGLQALRTVELGDDGLHALSSTDNES